MPVISNGMLKYDSLNVCNEFRKSNDSLMFIFCAANPFYQQISFQYVEIKVLFTLLGPNTVQSDYRLCLLFSLRGYLKLNLTGSFAFSAVFLPLLVLWYIFLVVNCCGSTSAYLLSVSSLFWCLLTYAQISIWSYFSMAKSRPLLSHPAPPLSSCSVLATSWHQQYILLATHCSSKYCISTPERGGLFFPSHLTIVVPSVLAGNSSGKKLEGEITWLAKMGSRNLQYAMIKTMMLPIWDKQCSSQAAQIPWCALHLVFSCNIVFRRSVSFVSLGIDQ